MGPSKFSTKYTLFAPFYFPVRCLNNTLAREKGVSVKKKIDDNNCNSVEMQPLPECVLIFVLASKLHEYAMFAWRHKKWSAHTILLKEGLMHTTQLCKCDFICAICEIYTNITLQLQLNQFKFFLYSFAKC